MIPLSAPDIIESDIEAVAQVLRSPRLSLGPMAEAFEQAIARHTGVDHAIAVSSGTAALHLCIRALNIGPCDEVIVPSFTFIAVANCVRYEQATPVFVDIDPITLNLDPARLEAAITPRTRAIIVVHTFGIPADMGTIERIAAKHNLILIEDACEAIGSEYQGRKAGSFGHAAVFAFYPNKQITTGEGGMVVTRDAALADRIRALRNQGRYPSDDWFQHTELGYNYRISEINCVLGLRQLQRIESILQQRERVARAYHQRLANHPHILPPPTDLPDRRISWFVYVVRLAASFTRHHRDTILQQLTAKGIGCGRYFAPIHLQPSYTSWRTPPSLPATEHAADRTIALPFFNRLTESEIQQVCDKLTNLLDQIPQAGLKQSDR
ncbi:MAG: DegT/DnrJ/EryC1/StrS family aminotransferase [Acidobacteriaceae bacterium]